MTSIENMLFHMNKNIIQNTEPLIFMQNPLLINLFDSGTINPRYMLSYDCTNQHISVG